MPPYVEPLADLGVPDDLTSPGRRGQDARHYIPPPSPRLGYFALSMAKDPRPIIVHEGIPGHYLQLARSWVNEDAIRRHYYDAGANEGIGFYAEEMLLQAGLFDDSPRTREIIYNFMRLRALRVEQRKKVCDPFAISGASDRRGARALTRLICQLHQTLLVLLSQPRLLVGAAHHPVLAVGARAVRGRRHAVHEPPRERLVRGEPVRRACRYQFSVSRSPSSNVVRATNPNFSRAFVVSNARRGWPSGFDASQRISPRKPTNLTISWTSSRIVIS